VRMVITVEGERIRNAEIDIGYLHRGFEKEAEHACYTQIFPYTDRLNYVSPMLNNVGWALAVEKLIGVQAPERAQYIRVIVGEMERLSDHMTCIAASAMEMGAFTPFLYLMKAREWIYVLGEELCGARLTRNYLRVGGVAWDLTADFVPKLRRLLADTREVLRDCDKLLTRNRIFRDRFDGTGVISRQDAIAYGVTGPVLRSTGVDYDVRKAHPYLVYERFDFDIPLGSTGDNYDRYLVRLEEMQQSMRILEQALDRLPEGPVVLDDYRVVMPPKDQVYNTIEGMIAHFKMVIDGIRVPAGEAYAFTEAANGELGFYVVADGSGRPLRCRCRGPSFFQTQALPLMIRGALISDVVATFGTINYIAGECER